MTYNVTPGRGSAVITVLASCLAKIHKNHLHLVVLLELWNSLSEMMKQGILAMVKASTKPRR